MALLIASGSFYWLNGVANRKREGKHQSPVLLMKTVHINDNKLKNRFFFALPGSKFLA